MGSFYSGFGGHKSYLGHCEGGIIYSGSGNRTPIGRYENGNIYNQFKEHVGSYSGGSIYNSSRTHIASYSGGVIYNQYLNAAVGREQVGSYDGDPAEAAALVLLFLGGDNINTRSGTAAEENTTTSRTTTYSSSDDSDTGCLGTLFSLIGLLIMGLFKLIFYYFKFVFLYLYPVLFSSVTIYYFPIMIIFGAVLGLEFLMLPIAIVGMLIMFSSIPYWVILFTQKRKRKMKWGETLKYYGKWLIKGPWAYKDIIELKNKPMSF